jgi:hypothetical protein
MTQLSYHYVETLARKKPKRSLRRRAVGWWNPVSPEEKRRVRRQAAVLAVAVALMAALLIFLRPGAFSGRQAGDMIGVIVWGFSAR